MPRKIWLSPPHMGGEEEKYIHDAFESNWIAPLGPHVDAFELEMCRYLHAGHAAALASGTAAIHLALVILGVTAGDEVICQSMTFSGSVNPVVYQQATPVFVDSEPGTWNLDPVLLVQAIEDRIRRGKKPKAVIMVHLYGQPAKIDDITGICKEYEIPLIEDAAEALGSTYRNCKVGTFGRFSILSFNGNKILTTSGGGMLLSPEAEPIRKARFLATQARDDAPHYEHSEIGYNYRMSNVLAAIGRGQLHVLNERIEQKRHIFDLYFRNLGRLRGITFQPEFPGTKSNRWLTTVLIDPESAGTNRESVRKTLQKRNIDARPLWKPMHLQPVFRKFPRYLNGTSEKLFMDGLCLPSGTQLQTSDVEAICSVIQSCFTNDDKQV